ncbi:hypothetical protein OIO90_000268 [Microbotryomycetes sp. JL221]|nr:hypothetical protein OIO90_000268 [Microbotryomycetes sp. JL221]
MPSAHEVKPIPQRGATNPVSRALSRATNFDLSALFAARRGPVAPRTVLVNVPPPPEATTIVPKVPIVGWKTKKQVELANGQTVSRKVQRGIGNKHGPAPGWQHESNQVLTSKYNLITFLPRNLLEQFRRVANVFFLALVILQFFPRFTTVSPGLSALPLLVVLFITAVKDGYEDLKRHQSDRAINNIKVFALKGTYHNHNLTKSKQRTFGLPSFISNLFMGRRLVKESEDAEEERQNERKKGFWGKRKVKRPRAGSKHAALNGQEPAEVPRDAPGGGTLQDAKKPKSSNGAGNGHAAVAPELHERLPGDHFDDENIKEEDGHHNSGGMHAPHLLGGHHASRAVWTKENWEDLRVGDFVRLRGDESVPADLLIVSTSEEENVCYVETKNLDGETNLKSRHAVPELTDLRTSTDIEQKAKFTIEAEAPSVNMFNFDAAVVMHDGRLGKDGKPLRAPVTLNTMLLRGTVVRNTEWVIGVVVMSGRDTKIVMNSGGTPSKRSKVERQMNPMVFLNLFLLGLMCAMCALGDHFLQVDQSDEGAYWLYGNNTSGDNPNVNGIITFANALIAFQNIVPISLYISIEFVRLVQAFFIWGDDEIYYKNNGTKRRTTARSWNLSDDLGQIEYIFSDKTGTLTQNAMVFRQCSVAGKTYIGDDEIPETTVIDEKMGKVDSSTSSENASKLPSGSDTDVEKGENGTDDGDEKRKTKLAEQVLTPFHDAEIDRDLADRNSKQAKHLYNFFANLALCHTVLAQDEDGLIAYKAQSPDEAALVQAAADVGFVFIGRDKNILKIQTPHDPDTVEFELLNVLEFSSARKRMSVVVRRLSKGPDQGKLILLSKGADNIIFERLGPGNEELKKVTDGHLEDFANEGLRTLCLAYRPLEDAEYDTWEREFHEATTLIEGREAAIERVSEKLEQRLILLGATAIEDRLQDGVPDAIAALKRAGLKIWVATGDKLETAIAIGKTCNLLSRDMNIIIIKGGEYSQPNSAYAQLKNALEKFFDVGDLVDRLYHQPTVSGLEHTPSRMSDSGRRPPMNRQNTGVSGITEIVGHDNGQRPGGYGLVIDGGSLRHAFEEPYTKDLLLELGTRCKTVVCCRTSPLQKALIVRLVKDGLGAMCLAIGDGANDVSMIQAADIGVGVAGEEGLQAVNSSDYAIGQFRYLQRLLLVHGHWSYMRNSSMIVNFFYKEIIGIAILWLFMFYCGFSATIIYEYIYLLLYNVVWTILPVLAIGIFDRNINDRVLYAVPELYKISRSGRMFNLLRFSLYMLDGTYQGAVIYFFTLYAYDTTTPRKDGYSITMYEFSTVMMLGCIVIANAYHALNFHCWNWWVLGSVLVGPVLIYAWTAVYAALPYRLLTSDIYGFNHYLWEAAYFWLCQLLAFVLALLPRYLYRFYMELYHASDVDILRSIDKHEQNVNWENDPRVPKPVTGGLPPVERVASPVPSNRRSRSFQIERVRSITHDMSTGVSSQGAGRGYGYDEAPAAPLSIARYTSRGSDHSSVQRNRKRAGSVKVAGVQLNPFARSPNRDRSSSILKPRIFGSGRKSIIREADENASASPTKAVNEGQPSTSASPSRHGPLHQQMAADADHERDSDMIGHAR